MHSKSKVYFFFQYDKFVLTKRTQLKKFIENIFKREGKKLESLNYIFCTDKALLEINKQFLKHDFYTDIITFDLSDSDAIRAEIYISIDRIKENALDHKVSFKQELHMVLIHGVLHLCGYKDKNKSDILVMRNKENFYLNYYFK